MPLAKGSSPKAISKNISQLVREGYGHEQAVAIAMENARKSMRYPMKSTNMYDSDDMYEDMYDDMYDDDDEFDLEDTLNEAWDDDEDDEDDMEFSTHMRENDPRFYRDGWKRRGMFPNMMNPYDGRGIYYAQQGGGSSQEGSNRGGSRGGRGGSRGGQGGRSGMNRGGQGGGSSRGGQGGGQGGGNNRGGSGGSSGQSMNFARGERGGRGGRGGRRRTERNRNLNRY